MKFLGAWLFRVWLLCLALALFVRALALAAVERLLGWSTGPFGVRVGDRLFHTGAVVWPTVELMFTDTFRTPDFVDGPGWTPEQLPKLWSTCRALAQKMGVPPPHAIHLSLEPGDCLAWVSRPDQGPPRGHIALSLCDLRLVTHDEARAVIAHEIAHLGYRHSEREFEEMKLGVLMAGAAEGLPFLLSMPAQLCRAIFQLGVKRGVHDREREADAKACQAVGGNHAAGALRRICLQAPVLARVFRHVLLRALAGPRAPLRLAEAAMAVYRTNTFPRLRKRVVSKVHEPGPEHPSPSDRIASAQRGPSMPGIGGDTAFIDAFPELRVAEELLTKTYFPDTPTHARSDASQLRRKALAARLVRR